MNYEVAGNIYKCEPGYDYEGSQDSVWYVTDEPRLKIPILLKEIHEVVNTQRCDINQEFVDQFRTLIPSEEVFLKKAMLKLRRHPCFTIPSKLPTIITDAREAASHLISQEIMFVENRDQDALLDTFLRSLNVSNRGMKRTEGGKIYFLGQLDFGEHVSESERESEMKEWKKYLFGDKCNYVVFDCNNPSILLFNSNANGYVLTKLEEAFDAKFFINYGYECKDKVWHNKKTKNILTQIQATKELHGIEKKILAIFYAKNVCDKVMKLHHHPAHVYWEKQQDYQVNGCDKNELETTFQKLLENDFQDLKRVLAGNLKKFEQK